MIDGLPMLMAAVTGFVGSHIVLSHPLRRPLIRALGETGFGAAYSVIAVIALLLVFDAYIVTDPGPPLWSGNQAALQIGFCLISYGAVALFLGALDNNPGLFGVNVHGLSTRPPTGAFTITRHPMLFAFSLWCAVQILIMPVARNLIVFGELIGWSLIGARMQDAKKIALTGREWVVWADRTPFWPDLRNLRSLGLIWALAAAPWLLVTWLEARVIGTPIGLWYFWPGLLD